MLFGLGRRSPVFAVFHVAHSRFGTPVLATVLVGGTAISAALAVPVAQLAGATSLLLLLLVFAVVNLALIGLKRRAPEAPFRVPAIVPWIGLLAALAAIVASVVGWD